MWQNTNLLDTQYKILVHYPDMSPCKNDNIAFGCNIFLHHHHQIIKLDYYDLHEITLLFDGILSVDKINI